MSKDKTKPSDSNVIVASKADVAIFNGVRREVPAVNSLCDESASQDLVQDAFVSFYDYEPKVSETAPSIQKSLVEQMMDLPEYKDLRTSSVIDDLTSSLATAAMGPNLIKQYEEMVKKMKEAQDKAEEKGEPGPESLDDALSEQDKNRLRHSLRQGLQKAQEQSDDWKDTCKAWGVDPGELASKPIGEKVDLAKKLMNAGQLKKITDLAGRFRNIVNSHAAITPSGGYDEIVDIGLSDDIARMLPAELVKMIEFPDLFAIDFAEGKLMTYELRAVEPQGKGPIIVCLDISASMSGSREVWSKAVILSLMALAEKTKRSFGVLCFDTKVRNNAFWPKSEPPTLDEKLQIAGIASDGGGTDFYPALMGAFKMRAAEPGAKKADIVFITDGECDLSGKALDAVLKEKEKSDVRIYSIAIQDGGYAETAGKTLEGFSDEIAVVNSLGEMDFVKGLIGRTASSSGQKKGKKVA